MRARPPGPRHGGFTLVELLIALTLLVLLSALLFGSLRLAGRSWDAGEAKVEQVSEIRQTEMFLRNQIAAMLPKRLRKAQDMPLLFAGTSDELRYTAALPERVVEGGTAYFRLALAKSDRGQLVLERIIPDAEATTLPEFDGADRNVLAERIGELKLGYFGRDPGAMAGDEPTWRDRWADQQRLPLLIRIEIRPQKGAPWPTLIVEPRRAPEAGCRFWVEAARRCQGM